MGFQDLSKQDTHPRNQHRQTDISHKNKYRSSEPCEPGSRANELLSRDDIQDEFGLARRWLELAALTGNGPPMIRISSRMVRYQRGDFEAWLSARKVTSTSQEIGAAA